MKTKIFAVISVLIVALCSAFVAIDLIFPVRYYDFIKNACRKYNVDPALTLAVVWTESKFRADAVSGVGACGLMQLMPSTAEWLTGEELDREKLFDPEFNIDTGVRYLAYLGTKFEGDYVLAAYNAGEGNVAKWLSGDEKIAFSETRDYIAKVNAVSKIYRLRTAR